MRIVNLIILFGLTGQLIACGSEDSGNSDSDVVAETDSSTNTSDENTTNVIVFDPNLFSSFSQISPFELVDCTLSNGEDSQCYTAVYENVRETRTVICPENVGEVGGLGIYDGTTNPGIRVLDDDLWADFATDGYDIINDDGTINIQVPEGGPGSGFIEAGSGISGSCLDAELDETYQITYTIPAYPTKATSVATTNSLEYWGLSLDGFPFAEKPPGAASQVGVAIPGLDSCGGHPQPDGPYHYHLVPHVIDDLLAQNDITKVVCEYIPQTDNAILGYARDGFAIYGTRDADDTIPNDLDQCQGHTHSSDDDNETYHYHITNELSPSTDTGYTNILPCTVGETAENNGFARYEQCQYKVDTVVSIQANVLQFVFNRELVE